MLQELSAQEAQYSHVLARKFGEVLIKLHELDLDSLVAALREVANLTPPGFVLDDRWQLEVRRRVAENILRAATWKHAPLETTQPFFRDLLDLGFTNIEAETFHLLGYARYLMEQSARGGCPVILTALTDCRSMLHGLRAKLQEGRKLDPAHAPPFYEDSMNLTDKVLVDVERILDAANAERARNAESRVDAAGS